MVHYVFSQMCGKTRFRANPKELWNGAETMAKKANTLDSLTMQDIEAALAKASRKQNLTGYEIQLVYGVNSTFLRDCRLGLNPNPGPKYIVLGYRTVLYPRREFEMWLAAQRTGGGDGIEVDQPAPKRRTARSTRSLRRLRPAA